MGRAVSAGGTWRLVVGRGLIEQAHAGGGAGGESTYACQHGVKLKVRAFGGSGTLKIACDLCILHLIFHFGTKAVEQANTRGSSTFHLALLHGTIRKLTRDNVCYILYTE